MSSSSTEQVYKEVLSELLEGVEKLEPIIQRAKHLQKASNQDEYIELIEEQNRLLKDRIKQFEDTASSSLVYPSNIENSLYAGCTTFSWNSFIMCVIFLWVFLIFLGF